MRWRAKERWGAGVVRQRRGFRDGAARRGGSAARRPSTVEGERVEDCARAARRDSKTEVLDVRRARERRERAAQVRRAVRGTREARRF